MNVFRKMPLRRAVSRVWFFPPSSPRSCRRPVQRRHASLKRSLLLYSPCGLLRAPELQSRRTDCLVHYLSCVLKSVADIRTVGDSESHYVEWFAQYLLLCSYLALSFLIISRRTFSTVKLFFGGAVLIFSFETLSNARALSPSLSSEKELKIRSSSFARCQHAVKLGEAASCQLRSQHSTGAAMQVEVFYNFRFHTS